jgi:restriction endonuclease S subunit
MSTYKLTNNKLNLNRVFILQKSEIDKRFDPQFYTPDLLELQNLVKKKQPKNLRGYVENISSGATPNRKEEEKYYTDSLNGIPFLRVQNITEYGLDLSDVKYINEETHNTILKRSQVTENDLLITITGRIASCTVAPQGFVGNINQHSVVVKTKSKMVSEMLASYLNSSIGQKLANRLATGGTRLALDYPALLSIPIIEDDRIQHLIKKAQHIKQQNEAEAEKLLASIDTYLLNELGVILPIQEKNTLQSRMFTTSLKELSSSRFDPNFHRIYFKDVFNSFENGKYEYSVIKNHTSFQPGYAFKSTDYVDDSNCILITIKNIRQNQIDIKNTTYLPDEFYEIYEDFQIKKDDLLIAMTGATIGKVGIYDLDEKSLLNQRNGIIKTTNINSIYLMNLLNLKVFQSIILRNSNGGAQPNISETDIMKIKIPVPPLEKQIEIANHISAIRQQAQALKDKSKLALQQANIEIENLLLN